MALSKALRHARTLARLGDDAEPGAGPEGVARYILEAARGFTHQVWAEPFAVGGLPWLPCRRTGQNLVAVVPPRGEIERRVVTVAHYDGPVGGTGRAQGCAIANPAGVAVALAAGERLAACRLERTEVWCAFTACRYRGFRGIRAFLDRHRRLFRDASFLILERAGAGPLQYVCAEGPVWSRSASPRLLGLVEAEAAAGRCGAVTGCSRTRSCSEGWAVRCRGLDAITLAGAEGAEPDADSLEAAVRLICGVVERIDLSWD